LSQEKMRRCSFCGRKCWSAEDWRAHMLERHPAQFKRYKRTWTFRSRIVPALVAGTVTVLLIDLNIRKPEIGPGMIIDAALSLLAIGLAFYTGYARLVVRMCEKTEKEHAASERKAAYARSEDSTSSDTTHRS